MSRTESPTGVTPSAMLRLVGGYLSVLFVLDAGKDALAFLSGRGPDGVFGFLTDAIPWWSAWVPLLLGALTLSQRTSPVALGWLRSVTLNFLGSVVLVGVHIFLVSLAFDLMSGVDDGVAVVRRMRRLGTIFVMPELLTVWGAVALLYSFSFGARLQAKELEATRLRAAMSEARLETLKREISPHFLFNALNSVGGLVRTGRGEAATEMLNALATLLRRSLDQDDRAEIRLDEEMYLLDQYVRVEKARWGEALTVEMRLDEGLEDASVPPLVLQPLVENAIRHGMDGGGTIQVRASGDGRTLRLAVLDPGGPEARMPSSGFGIGLSNTRERLDCLYGAEAALTVHAVEGGGKHVQISLPLRHLPITGPEASHVPRETVHG